MEHAFSSQPGTHGDLPEKCPCHDDITAAFMKEGRLKLQSSKEDMKTFLKEQLRNHQDGEVLLSRTQETADDLEGCLWEHSSNWSECFANFP
jgi:hypothetical protein